MISILIPIYNISVCELVQSIHKQAVALNIPFEIILIDDNSEQQWKDTNKQLSTLQNVEYKELTENIGRAKIRNLLADTAQYPYLLFIDCDAEIDNTSFIDNYLSECKGTTIVCGGIKYDNNCPNKDFYLRWKYGIKRECKKTDFLSSNFLISKGLFDKIKFNELFPVYGFEDTFFRFSLHKQGIKSKKINNPLIHKGLYDAEEFILRTEVCLRSLSDLYQKQLIPDDFLEYLRIGKTYKKLYRLHLPKVVASFYNCTHFFSKWMIKKTSSLFLLDIYKIGFFCKQMNHAK